MTARERAESLFQLQPAPDGAWLLYDCGRTDDWRWKFASESEAREKRAQLAAPIAASILAAEMAALERVSDPILGALVDATAAAREACAQLCDAAAADARRHADGEAADSPLRGHWRRMESQARDLAAAMRGGPVS